MSVIICEPKTSPGLHFVLGGKFRLATEFEKKTIFFIIIFLENSENLGNFTKISNKLGEF